MGEGRDLFYFTCFACDEVCKTAADGGLTSHVVGGAMGEGRDLYVAPPLAAALANGGPELQRRHMLADTVSGLRP